jgi:hypothetical protein
LRRKKTPPVAELKKSWEEQTRRRSGHILRRRKTPPAELKKKLGGTEWKKEWPHFEEEKNTSCC